MIIKVEHNIDKVVSYLGNLAKEIPFATALALTRTAQDVQAAIIEELPQKFTLRTGWYRASSPYGFKIERATKTNLTSSVFSKAPWLPLQESGGIKRVAGKRLAIPTQAVRRTKRDLVKASEKPLALKKAFPIKLKDGTTMLAMRRGRGRKAPLQFLYTLSKQAKITPRLRFFETARRVVAAKWAQRFAEAMEYAIRTAK